MHQLLRDLDGQPLVETPLDIDRGEFCHFATAVVAQFSRFPCDVGAFGIGLGADRNVFAGRHRHRPCDQA
jgi:hypothetical protein